MKDQSYASQNKGKVDIHQGNGLDLDDSVVDRAYEAWVKWLVDESAPPKMIDHGEGNSSRRFLDPSRLQKHSLVSDRKISDYLSPL